jgi:hypothetical protein
MKSEFAFGEVLRSNVRYDLWTAAWSLIKESPVFGYGLGDGKDLMVEYTSHIDRVTQLQISADAHNQFLQSWLDFGVVGPILVLAILFIYFIKMKKKPDLMRYGLPLLFIIIMFFEVILHRLSGVLLFSTLLLFPPTKTKASPNRIKIFSASLIASALLLILFGILGQLMNQFNSEEPSSYMSLAHSEIEYQNLPDDVPKGIPVGTKGCLLNRNSFEKKLEDNLFAQSIIDEQNVKNGDSIALSVYCYIGETFNGDQVRISGRGQIREPNDRYANMKLRNQWQFLSVNTTADKGRALLVLTIGKQLASDTDSIVGEVIFAYPSMRINKR